MNKNSFSHKMKTLRGVALLWILAAFQAPSSTVAEAQSNHGSPYQKRWMTYNVHHCEGLDKKIDIDRIAGVINRVNPDVIALQELDSMTVRSGKTYQLKELADKTLRHAVFGSAMRYDGGSYGVGILSKEAPLSVRRIPLPGIEPRLLLVVEFRDYVYACTHLDLKEENRLTSAALIQAEAGKWNKPFIVAGDWNDKPKSKLLKRLASDFRVLTGTGTPTFPANEPKECIDYIACSNARPVVALERCCERETVASDHRPIWTDVRLRIPSADLMKTRPYLQDPKPTQMTVMFQTTAPAHCWVEYGTDSLHTRKARTLLDGQEVCFDIENKIVVDSLKPGTRYYYRVCVVDLMMKHAYENHFGDTLKTRFYSFRTPSEADKDFTCVVFNDLHEQYDVYKSLLEKAKSIGYDFGVFNGDCLPEPSSREHALEMIHTLADVADGAEHPIFFIRGNHEIRNFYSAGMHRLIGYPDDKTYGAWNWGDTRFMVLDCGEDKPDDTWVYAGLNDFTQLRGEQMAFIKNELKSKAFKKAKRHVLICHIPIFGPTDKYHPCKDMWGPVLAKQPFDIALFAHEHSFKYVETGLDGAQFPVYHGGGPTKNSGTVAVLQKKGDKFTFRTLSDNAELEITKELDKH